MRLDVQRVNKSWLVFDRDREDLIVVSTTDEATARRVATLIQEAEDRDRVIAAALQHFAAAHTVPLTDDEEGESQ